MIADWTVDVGPDSPVIAVPWEGWVNLRAGLDASIEALPEVRQYPELRAALSLLNRCHCLTAKVDVFPVTREEVDPEIAEAGEEATAFGLGSYLDVLLARHDPLGALAEFAALARQAASALNRTEASPNTAGELVVRAARLYDQDTFGWTLYAMGFGATEGEARESWAGACRLVADAFNREAAAAIARREQAAPQEGNAGE